MGRDRVLKFDLRLRHFGKVLWVVGRYRGSIVAVDLVELDVD